jgi:hypothetical protein
VRRSATVRSGPGLSESVRKPWLSAAPGPHHVNAVDAERPHGFWRSLPGTDFRVIAHQRPFVARRKD